MHLHIVLGHSDRFPCAGSQPPPHAQPLAEQILLLEPLAVAGAAAPGSGVLQAVELPGLLVPRPQGCCCDWMWHEHSPAALSYFPSEKANPYFVKLLFGILCYSLDGLLF